MTRRAREGLAGVFAALAGVVTTEVVGLGSPTDPSLLLAVQAWFIDAFGASLKELAVALFGTADKTALEVGAYLVVVLLGLGAGRLESVRRGLGAGLVVALALAGTLASLAEPQHHAVVSVAAGALGAVAGVTTLWVLFDRFGLRVMPGAALVFRDRRPAVPAPPRGPLAEVAGSRREVLTWSLGTGAAVTIGAAVAKGLGDTVRRTEAAIPDRLPPAARTVSLPARQPFSADGLTPYVVPNAEFYRIDTSPNPPYVITDEWVLKFTGLVDRELTFTYADLLARDLVEEVVTLSCVSNEVGGDLVGNAVWTGIPLRTLLDEAGVQPGATQLVGEAVDGFTAGFPTAALDDPARTALVAVGMNGAPLPRAHGFPARLVVSGLYGYVSATKWLSEVRLTTLEDEDGYWIDRGWAKEAPVKTQSRIDVPRNRSRLVAGTVAVAGVAWAPSRGIAKVEVQVDEGRWQEARLGRVTSDDTWVQWYLPWEATPGDHVLTVRATDGDGLTQGEALVAPVPDGAEGWHTRRVEVAER